jgi:hypothetical protein
MNGIVPDTLTGALLLSVIDFMLSFVVIAFIGLVLAALPLINRVARHAQALPPPSVREVDMEAEDHIAAIAAAIHVIMGAHRIIHIEAVRHGPEWVSEGRAAQHASHDPSRRRRR